MATPNLDLFAEAAAWRDTVKRNKAIVERFTDYVNADPELKVHRDFIEKRAYGCGERCFHWMWKLIVDEMPQEFNFLEIGVYKGQVLSLVRLLADRTGKNANILGVTPLSTFAGTTGKFPLYPDDDYKQHIKNLHDHFGQEMPHIAQGDSTDPKMQQAISQLPKFDVVYIDGCHELDYVLRDLLCYGACVRDGGLLVVDDASCYLAPVWGHFQGIEDVCQAVRTVIETDMAWEHLLAVMHNRVFLKVGSVGEGKREPEVIQRYKWTSNGSMDVPVAVKVK